MEDLTHPLKNERRQTDDSLDVERGKTDESFAAFKKDVQSTTDKAVSEMRLEADGNRARLRSAEDKRQTRGPTDSVGVDERSSDRETIQKERRSEDRALKKERSENDMALELERGENVRQLSKLVGLERETTDKSLSRERTKTDKEAVRSAERLTLELEAHLDTKSALTTREEFVAIVSHDLRNPLGAILSFAEILQEENLSHEISKDAKQWIEIIIRNAQTSLRLIGDILDMERIEGGKLKVQLSLHPMAGLVAEAVEGLQNIALTKKIKLTAEKEILQGQVACDRDRILQIFSNLIGNALKFTPDGGAVTVKAEDKGDEILFSVQDTGPGIPEEQKIRIFNRFAQIGNKDRGGLGLGLYISKTLVESHNGKIWVSSSPGQGSTFFFTLPK